MLLSLLEANRIKSKLSGCDPSLDDLDCDREDLWLVLCEWLLDDEDDARGWLPDDVVMDPGIKLECCKLDDVEEEGALGWGNFSSNNVISSCNLEIKHIKVIQN